MRQLKIVVADDHQLMIQAIRLALEGTEDIEIVAEADSGSKVMPLVSQTSPDLVLLDIRMPGMDGLTVLERLRERYPKVRVAILSAVDDPAVIQAAFNRGASAFIVKHIDPRDLAAAVRQAIAGAIFQPLGLIERATDAAAREADLSKRELNSRTEAVRYAFEHGLADRPQYQVA
jgi:DNA-binding NarL/FixJ family response regulator